jgi:hypothetical protein
MEKVLEPRREWWMQMTAWAAWILYRAEDDERWQEFYAAASAMVQGRELQEISLMHTVAAGSWPLPLPGEGSTSITDRASFKAQTNATTIEARLTRCFLGRRRGVHRVASRARVGYMSQSFSR